jgi:hypothetical protein
MEPGFDRAVGVVAGGAHDDLVANARPERDELGDAGRVRPALAGDDGHVGVPVHEQLDDLRGGPRVQAGRVRNPYAAPGSVGVHLGCTATRRRAVRGQRPVDLQGIGRTGEAVAQVGVLEHAREPGQDRDVLLRLGSKPDDQPCPLVTPRHTVRKLRDCEARLQDRFLVLARAMWQRDPVAEVGGDDPLALVHGLDVLVGDQALGHEETADPVDRLRLRGGAGADDDRRRPQDLRRSGRAHPAAPVTRRSAPPPASG